jgi:hypothetical protein
MLLYFFSVSFGVEADIFLSSVLAFHTWQRENFIVLRSADGKTNIVEYEEVPGVSSKVTVLRIYSSQYSTIGSVWWIFWSNENFFAYGIFWYF